MQRHREGGVSTVEADFGWIQEEEDSEKERASASTCESEARYISN